MTAVLVLAACSSAPDEVTGDPLAMPDASVDPDAERENPRTKCLGAFICPQAAADRVNLCGWLADVESSQLLIYSDEAALTCDDLSEQPDACRVSLTLEDASGTALAVEELRRDGCGRFLARGITPPPSGTVVIATDDADGVPDIRRRTAFAVATANGEVRNHLVPYSLLRETENDWNAVADATFVDDGAVLEVYERAGEPLDGLAIGAGDVAFADSTIDARTFVAPLQTATGVNGAVLRRGPGLAALPVPTGAPAGCSWTTPYSAIVPGTLWFSTRTLVDETTGEECQ